MEHSHKHTISRVLSLYHCSDAVTSSNTTKENSYITNLLTNSLSLYLYVLYFPPFFFLSYCQLVYPCDVAITLFNRTPRRAN